MTGGYDVDTQLMRFRKSELLLIAFFVYTAAVAFAIRVPTGMRGFVVTLNLALVGWSFLFAWAHPGRGFYWLDRVRDWWPLVALLVALRETSWLSLVRTPGRPELTLMRWDRWVLIDSGLQGLLDAGALVVPAMLEVAYLLALALPAVMVGLFYITRQRERIDDAWSIVLIAVLSTFAIWPWMPIESPRLVFPGQLLPPETWPRRIVLALADYAGGRGGAFPSARVALAFAISFAMLRLLKERLAAGLAGVGLSILVALAAVYGRYHYAADVAGGIAAACVAGAAGLLLTNTANESRRADRSFFRRREEMF